ncbi:MAG: hypothetical protein ACR2OZ_04025 [Verrucomicrobiales bacterium]
MKYIALLSLACGSLFSLGCVAVEDESPAPTTVTRESSYRSSTGTYPVGGAAVQSSTTTTVQ